MHLENESSKNTDLIPEISPNFPRPVTGQPASPQTYPPKAQEIKPGFIRGSLTIGFRL